MATKNLILEPDQYDLNHIVADIEEIRRFNPQRHEMEQLTAVVFDDAERGIVVGYKDVAEDEFWTRGHMPNMPLMPGIVMCEAAAQLCTYLVQKHDLLGAEMIGFGGLDKVRFRGMVTPGDRLVILSQRLQVRRGQMIRSRFQCLVENNLVCQGEIRGVPIPVDVLQAKG